MAKFIMLGKYSAEAVCKISAQRTQTAVAAIKDGGGEVQEMYTMLGGSYDLMLLVDLPNTERAMQISVQLTRSTGIAFCTCPALSVEEFDRLCK